MRTQLRASPSGFAATPTHGGTATPPFMRFVKSRSVSMSGAIACPTRYRLIYKNTKLCRRRLALRLHLGGIIVHQLLGDGAGREPPVRDLRHRRHLGGRAGDE